MQQTGMNDVRETVLRRPVPCPLEEEQVICLWRAPDFVTLKLQSERNQGSHQTTKYSIDCPLSISLQRALVNCGLQPGHVAAIMIAQRVSSAALGSRPCCDAGRCWEGIESAESRALVL